MVESIKSLTKNIDVSKNSSSNTDKVGKLNASSISQKPAVDTAVSYTHLTLPTNREV